MILVNENSCIAVEDSVLYGVLEKVSLYNSLSSSLGLSGRLKLDNEDSQFKLQLGSSEQFSLGNHESTLICCSYSELQKITDCVKSMMLVLGFEDTRGSFEDSN